MRADHSPRYQRALVACARWETQYISEWLVYHRHLGFDHVYLYCNDDDPAELYEAVLPFLQGPESFVDFFHFGIQGLQTQMYLHFLKNHAHECKRFMFLDIDEFLIIKNCLLEEFLTNYPDDTGAILFNWVMGGNSNFVTRPSGPVWSHYARRQKDVHPFTKCLINSKSLCISRINTISNGGFWHYPAGILHEKATMINVLRRDMRQYYEDFPSRAEEFLANPEVHGGITRTAYIYHLAFKSEEDLRLRVARGVGGDFYGQSKWGDISNSGADQVRAFMNILNAEEEVGLQQIWADILRGARTREIVQPPPGLNIARGKAAVQSSTSEWSRSAVASEDAAGLVNGHPRGVYQNHTALELNPWWQVDLDQDVDVREVRIFNRLDMPQRFTRFSILASTEGDHWRTVFTKDDDVVFGGADGKFFVWRPEDKLRTRFLRIQVFETSFITLDQVEVYSV